MGSADMNVGSSLGGSPRLPCGLCLAPRDCVGAECVVRRRRARHRHTPTLPPSEGSAPRALRAEKRSLEPSSCGSTRGGARLRRPVRAAARRRAHRARRAPRRLLGKARARAPPRGSQARRPRRATPAQRPPTARGARRPPPLAPHRAAPCEARGSATASGAAGGAGRCRAVPGRRGRGPAGGAWGGVVVALEARGARGQVGPLVRVRGHQRADVVGPQEAVIEVEEGAERARGERLHQREQGRQESTGHGLAPRKRLRRGAPERRAARARARARARLSAGAPARGAQGGARGAGRGARGAGRGARGGTGGARR